MDVWAARAYANGLGAGRARSVVDAVRNVVALQGQDVRATRLAVRARTGGLTAGDVDGAVARGEVVRTWAMRGTLHLVAAADLRWVTKVFGPYFRDRQRPRRGRLGLTDDDCARGVRQLATFLREPMTRAEIVERVDLDLRGQAAPYFLAFAAFEGVVCRGPERGSEPTYVLVDDWVAGGEDSLLALRYLRGYGPASPADLAAWSGLPLTAARRAFDEVRDLIEPVGDLFWLRDRPVVDAVEARLLGHFDAFLLGYRERPVSAAFRKVIQTGGGFVMPAVSVSGRIHGVWSLKSTPGPLGIEVTPFTTITARLTRELSGEAADLGRFLGRRAELSVGAPRIAD
ncbi:winged helix DNA-binding domain-containing protein [Actinophytocola glycyrrhizae]|uniref:Winged helix DNA-binding domain-containing protein n=1 Tax=Actinophytocola glycyrrhizae TaxID=2044873 RepID=A0ABV9S2R6_9PSEU